MAKRATTPVRPVNVQPEYTKYVCDKCKHAVWDMSFANRDWRGKPICLTCPFEKWKMVRGHQACAKFERKEGGNE